MSVWRILSRNCFCTRQGRGLGDELQIHITEVWICPCGGYCPGIVFVPGRFDFDTVYVQFQCSGEAVLGGDNLCVCQQREDRGQILAFAVYRHCLRMRPGLVFRHLLTQHIGQGKRIAVLFKTLSDLHGRLLTTLHLIKFSHFEDPVLHAITDLRRIFRRQCGGRAEQHHCCQQEDDFSHRSLSFPGWRGLCSSCLILYCRMRAITESGCSCAVLSGFQPVPRSADLLSCGTRDTAFFSGSSSVCTCSGAA